MRLPATWAAPRRARAAAGDRHPRHPLLQQLSKLAEEEGDLETAARYQKLTMNWPPATKASRGWRNLYARAGELEEAQAVWSKMAAGKSGRSRVFQAIDSLLTNQKPSLCSRSPKHAARDPHDWEAVYRSGVALWQLSKSRHEAASRFKALLALTIGDDEKSAMAKARARKPGPQAAAAPTTGAARVRRGVAARTSVGGDVPDPLRIATGRSRHQLRLVSR